MSPSSERMRARSTEPTKERASIPEDVRRSQDMIFRFCTLLSSLDIPEETFVSRDIPFSLFENIRRLSARTLSSVDWGTWRNIVGEVMPRLTAVAETTEEGRLFLLREWHKLDRVEACDARAIELLSPDVFSAEERIDIRMKLGTLSEGKILKREILGNVQSTNAPSRYHLDSEDGGSLVAYVKARLKEATFKLDKGETVNEDGETVSSWNVYQQVFDSATNTFDWKKEEKYSLDPGLRELFRQVSSEGFQEAVRELIARDSGMSPEDVPYDSSEFNARIGVLPGEMTIREWAISRFDLLLGMKLVPLTVIRPEPGAHDIASVQEAVPVKDPRHQARELTLLEAEKLFDRPPEEWVDIFPAIGEHSDDSLEQDPLKREPVRSIVRAGVFAHLMGDLDGIEVNLMLDPVTKKFSKIDNGLAWGAVTGQEVKFKVPLRLGSSKMVEATHMDVVRSVPLELTLRHGLYLDDEAHAHLTSLYESLRSGGPEREHALSILSVLFDSYGKKMVERQLEDFLGRLQNIVEHGRLVGLEKGVDYMTELEQASFSRKSHAQAA